MKTTAILTVLSATFFAVTNGKSEAPEGNTPEPIKVFLVDDQSGVELKTKHGIQPLQVDDILVLVNAVLLGHTPVQLVHQAIDEDVSDNPATQLVFKPFAGDPPPTAPTPNMPLREFTELATQFKKDREKWQNSILAYRNEVVADAETFIQKVEATQLEVAQRMDQKLQLRNGRDYNRSDICGSIAVGNRVLGNSGKRVIIFNSDCDDCPGKRRPRKTPLTQTDLDPGIELIFVNTSRIPERSILFTGLKNSMRHADSMKEAMEIVVEMLKPQADTTSATAAQKANPLTTFTETISPPQQQ